MTLEEPLSSADLPEPPEAESPCATEPRHELWLLKTHLKSKGMDGVDLEGGGFQVADPIEPGKSVVVRDAVAFGYTPTIEGTRSSREYAAVWAHDDIPQLDWLSQLDKLLLVERQADCPICPDDLGSPNPVLVEEAAKRDEGLAAALRLNMRLSLVVIGKNCFVHDTLTKGMMSPPAVKPLLASDRYLVAKAVPVLQRDGTPRFASSGEPVTRLKEEWVEAFFSWNASPLRRTYHGVEFAPNNLTATGEQRNPNKLNKWVGFAYAKSPTIITSVEADAAIILGHFERVFHSGNKETLDYELKWLSHMLQFPQEKPHAHIARFEPTGGTGKDIIGNMLRFKIIGQEHSTTASGNEQLCNNFNANYENAILIVGNEIAWGKSHSSRHKLYDETASVMRQIEPKGVDRYEVYNYTRYILHSNDPNPINVQKGDRRFLALRCHDISLDFNDGKADPRYREYFVKLGQACSDTTSVQAFVGHLLSLDLSDFNRFRAPDTDAKRELVELNLTDDHKWLLHLARSGQIEGKGDTFELDSDQPTAVPKRAAQEAAAEFFNQRERALETTVGKVLSGDGLVRSGERKIGGKKERFYVFPPLGEFRSKVAKIVGLTVDECTGAWESLDD